MGEPTLEDLGRPLRELHERFAELTEPHRPALWRYCLRLTGSPWDAEDLVQETLMKAFARLTLFWQPIDPRAYLFRIASNTWIDGLRRAGATLGEFPDTHGVSTTPAPGADTGLALVDPADTIAAMETLVGLLPPSQRVVVLLTDVFDFRVAEVATMLGTTEGAVKAALHRARATLRAHSGNQGESAGQTVPHIRPPNAVVARFLEAFNRRDPDAIAALLDTEATVDIVGVAEERGREVTRKYSLAEWAAEAQPQWAELAYLFGRPVVCVFYRTAEHEKALAWLITLETAEDRVVIERQYFYCPELIELAARELGVPCQTHGYRYVPPTPQS